MNPTWICSYCRHGDHEDCKGTIGEDTCRCYCMVLALEQNATPARSSAMPEDAGSDPSAPVIEFLVATLQDAAQDPTARLDAAVGVLAYLHKWRTSRGTKSDTPVEEGIKAALQILREIALDTTINVTERIRAAKLAIL